jgi:hypothetical protein
MKYAEVRRGARVRTTKGEPGTVVSKSNGTVYLQLDDGRFERFVVADVHEAGADSQPASRGLRGKG